MVSSVPTEEPGVAEEAVSSVETSESEMGSTSKEVSELQESTEGEVSTSEACEDVTTKEPAPPEGDKSSEELHTTCSDDKMPENLNALDVDYVFPNAKEGEPYCAEDIKSKLFGRHAASISHYYMEGLDGSGLNLVDYDDVVEGTPILEASEPKTFSITVYFHWNKRPRGRPLVGKARLLVNPDPTKLWKNIPSNAELPYHKKDEDSAIIVDSAGHLVGASKRGRSHAHDGSCRDDDFLIRFFHQTGWWLSVVADGAGSAKFSRKGSEIATRTGAKRFEESIEVLESEEMTHAIAAYTEGNEEAGNIIRRNLINLFTRKVGYEAFKAIHEHATAQKNRARDFNTTFLAAAWKQISEGKWFVCAFAIGDGGVAVITDGARVTTLNTGDEGQYSGETVFLTTNSVWESANELAERVRFGVFEQIQGIYSMTDGVTDPKFGTDHNFSSDERWGQFLAELDENVHRKDTEKRLDHRLLNWLDFWSPGNHDDRTITIFHPAH